MFGWRKQSQSAVSLVNSRVEVFNVGLNLAMEWGEDWLQPIQRRLPIMTARFQWVNTDNLSRLFSQGMYYAWKDLGFA